MKITKLLALALTLCLGGSNLWAQTNLISGWDGGDDTSSPSNFGWTSSTNRTLAARNNNGGVRMTTTYSGYKLEDGTSYSYSESSEPSSVIFWVRYGTAGESFTYTFKGLEPDAYYDFSALIGWHNNSNAPTLTVELNDGTNTLATMSKKVSDKQTLYAISSLIKAPSTMTTESEVNIVFTCNQTGDCMEAISALSLVKSSVTDLDFAKENAIATLPETAGDNFFTMPQTTIDAFKERINAATTETAVEEIKEEIANWAAPALQGTWNIKNVTAANYLGTDGENVVLSELPVAITFEKASNGFYIKAGDSYINMKGNNGWSMSASETATTAWTFTLNDGIYTISGPNGMIGTDDTTAGSYCYGNKGVGNNGTWTITEAISEDQIAITLAKNALEAALNAVSVPTANIGSGVFQYNREDVEALAAKVASAQSVLASETATKEEIEAQTEIISGLSSPSLKAPAEADIYSLYLVDGLNKTVTFKSGNANQGTYNIGYTEDAGSAYNQAIHFVQVEGNQYNLYIVDAEGEKQYICTSATAYDDGTRTDRIRMTSDVEKALVIEVIATNEEGIYNLYNTEAKALIGSNGDTGFYTSSTYKNFNINPAATTTVAIDTEAAGWATLILPFAAEIPTGLKAYSVETVTNDALDLVPVTSFEANKPYILEGAVQAAFTDYGVAKDATYTAGLLTGVYADTEAAEGVYVLQNQEAGLGFYQVAEVKPTVKANRAFLTYTAPAEEGGVKAFILGGTTTGIEAIERVNKNAAIFNLAGQRVQKTQKGIFIVNGKKVVK